MKNKIINKETFIEFINERLNGNLYEENGRLYYNGYLSFPDTDVLFLPDNLTVTGSLSLEDQCNTFLPQGLIVAENLNLEYSNVLSLPEDLIVGESIYLRNSRIISLPDNFTVGGMLDLRDTDIVSLPQNLTVGGSLYLENSRVTSLPDNLTVGGGLYMQDTDIASLPDNLTVAGYLDLPYAVHYSYLSNLCAKYLVNRHTNDLIDISKVNRKFNIDLVEKIWGKAPFIKIDKIFEKKISHTENVWEVKKIGGTKISFIVSDGLGKYAWGKTIKKAKENLPYIISHHFSSYYKDLTLDSTLRFPEVVECYCTIAEINPLCIQPLIEDDITEQKGVFSVSEIIELTKGKPGNKRFKSFFYNPETRWI